MDSPYHMNPAKSGRTVPYSPSKEHMIATIESHGTSPEKPRQSILKGDRKKTTIGGNSSDQDGSAKFYQNSSV